MDDIHISNLPRPLHWLNQPQSWDLSPEGLLTITAPATTDWFIDPGGAVNLSNAPVLLFPTSGPCILRAQVSANHLATFDAGVLFVYESPLAWAKLCLELSPQGHPTIVSVVTKGISDDCNAFPVTGSMYMRVSKLEKAYAFHVSENGVEWDLIRYFGLEDNTNAQLGFLAQSPTGNGCTASFAQLHFEERLLADIRSGE
jgi:regulation of enolase protein 1 (concanavalin A-like superfamily)